MNCPKCDRPMAEIKATSGRPYTRRFKCEWCRYSWEGIVNKILYDPLRAREGYEYGGGFPDI